MSRDAPSLMSLASLESLHCPFVPARAQAGRRKGLEGRKRDSRDIRDSRDYNAQGGRAAQAVHSAMAVTAVTAVTAAQPRDLELDALAEPLRPRSATTEPPKQAKSGQRPRARSGNLRVKTLTVYSDGRPFCAGR